MRPKTPEQLWKLSRRLHAAGHPVLARLVKTLNWALHKCLLPAEAIVGENLVLEHYALGVVIHPQTTIGQDCRIYHHVTLASESPIGSNHRIILEDSVTIGANAVVIARANSTLSIGSGSIVGAGSVLTRSIPAGEVWAGNPARKLRDRNRPDVDVGTVGTK